MRIERLDSDGTRRKLVDISSDTYTSYFNDAGKYKPSGKDWYLENLATFSAQNNVASVRLLSRFVPGTYSWYVSRKDGASGHVSSARRTFVVGGQPLRKLKLKLRGHRGGSSRFPGSTSLAAYTTPYTTVRFKLTRHGRRSTLHFRADASGHAGFTQQWSCSVPGGVYRVVVIARDEYGATKRTTGHFRPVSKVRCRSMRRAEAAARRAQARRVAARQRAQERRDARAYAQRVQRYRANCRVIGGIPRTIQSSEGSYPVCVAPLGGLLYVPW